MSSKSINNCVLKAREEEIMDTALEIITAQGIAGLTIDKVAAKIPYSKGTIYNHFTCKEDLLTGLCNRSVENLYNLFYHAASFDGCSREKILAIGYAYMLHALLNPTEFMLVISAKTPSIGEKSSEKRREEHLHLEGKLLENILHVISEGLTSGDFKLQSHLSPAQVAFALWSMCFGTIVLLHESLDRCSVRTEMELERELINHANLMLDGLNWKPYTQEHDWAGTLKKYKTELFADEVRQLKRLQNK
ncbi:TetR/AcrR family transcriptional regulator [Neptuniibacter marinus]|uniref:TetR/AcrR family transcriptional regulator n=1 Tax=Neptuniibacter marinus TaxID=1806670 RepID=UPI0008367A91|nr:TetR/AcrR family transcriptional regulator [Neptuniibacter marinus]